MGCLIKGWGSGQGLCVHLCFSRMCVSKAWVDLDVAVRPMCQLLLVQPHGPQRQGNTHAQQGCLHAVMSVHNPLPLPCRTRSSKTSP